MAESKESKVTIVSSSVEISQIKEAYKITDYEVVLVPKASKPLPKKRSVWESIWVWFLLVLGLNFAVGDPIGFTENHSLKESPPYEMSPEYECVPLKSSRGC